MQMASDWLVVIISNVLILWKLGHASQCWWNTRNCGKKKEMLCDSSYDIGKTRHTHGPRPLKSTGRHGHF